jgi:hypothetical protein
MFNEILKQRSARDGGHVPALEPFLNTVIHGDCTQVMQRMPEVTSKSV